MSTGIAAKASSSAGNFSSSPANILIDGMALQAD
jgi:hypothetical protein